MSHSNRHGCADITPHNKDPMKTIWTHIDRHRPKGPYITVSDLEDRRVRFIACAGGKAPPTLVELDRAEILTLVDDLQRYLEGSK